MNKMKLWIARRFFSDFMSDEPSRSAEVRDAPGSSTKRQMSAPLLKRIGYRTGDVTSRDFVQPEFDLTQITNGYNTDSYIRQGVDKYIDQIFKEGYDFYGKDTAVVDYIKLRFAYMAEATATPTGQFFIDIAEDIVKYANCIIAKARASDPASLPPGAKIAGLNGKQPVAGYFCVNVPTMWVKRDKNGTVLGWQQQASGGGNPVNFNKDDIIHIYYKREKGNGFGTSFLIPALDDVRALRQAEENVLRMMYRNIYPFYHVAVGDKDMPGSSTEVTDLQDTINNMDVEGGIVTTNRVVIKPIASDQVINAEPYLKYLEERVFTGLGVPAIMFGRGNTANRSTGDNMTSEMADRITAIDRTIEMFINTFIIKELLMEGGFDPVLNPDQNVEFKFKENDLDTKIKADTHAIYQYEHNAITEDEMRSELNRDPLTDRSKMFQTLVTQANVAHAASVQPKVVGTGGTTAKPKAPGTAQTNNKQKPTNQSGTKTSPKKVTNALYEGMVKDAMYHLTSELNYYLQGCMDSKEPIKDSKVMQIIDRTTLLFNEVIHETLDELQYDQSTISSKVATIYNQCKTDLENSLKDLQDYNEVNSLVDIVLDLTQEELLQVI